MITPLNSRAEVEAFFATILYCGSCSASGSSGFLGLGRGAWANKSVTSTDCLLLLIIVDHAIWSSDGRLVKVSVFNWAVRRVNVRMSTKPNRMALKYMGCY